MIKGLCCRNGLVGLQRLDDLVEGQSAQLGVRQQSKQLGSVPLVQCTLVDMPGALPHLQAAERDYPKRRRRLGQPHAGRRLFPSAILMTPFVIVTRKMCVFTGNPGCTD